MTRGGIGDTSIPEERALARATQGLVGRRARGFLWCVYRTLGTLRDVEGR